MDEVNQLKNEHSTFRTHSLTGIVRDWGTRLECENEGETLMITIERFLTRYNNMKVTLIVVEEE
jgi:hypothetical protein